ncbi:MAG: helix-turn-helix transcriptional regulator [Acidobacteria bacterium]|nr:helix-turn-helix transcriptional regulator [Acidobacteriota bacterium]MXZ72951.1 helix-turn-helix transcriptional regulator [Acidobacteriota bacterium]MYD71098.1 helix-turn-helix transcriptional regulator [Acidobacteriota bacterium]MYJ04302.1 helix-turn-helix transcriptional regulator [Acidobacteriota bacterium]
MAGSLTETAQALKAARLAKGMSQRELSARSGLTQAHISRIENAAVDVRLPNLIELARVLDLEMMLVPRPLAPAVRDIIRSHRSADGRPSARSRPRPAYRLDDDEDAARGRR